MSISKLEARMAAAERTMKETARDMAVARAEAVEPMTAAKRQARLDVVTICNAAWLDTHTARFIHLGRRAMPDARFHLLFVGSKAKCAASATPDQFDSVKVVPDKTKGQPGYLGYNEPRYTLCERFGLDEVVYIDPDVDIVADISHITDDCPASLGWCRSPVEPAGFADAMCKCSLSVPRVWANSGTLVMRGNFGEAYEAASTLAAASGVDPRMVGNFAFSVMLQYRGVEHCEIPYKYGTIWWDRDNFARAQCLHYCNDKGKQRRVALASVWVS